MSEPAYDSVRFYKDQLDKPAEESKKWRLVNRGMLGVLGIFIVSALLLFVKPDLAGNLTTLAQIVVTSFAGLVAVGCGSIAAVDFKNSSALENTVKTVTQSENQKIQSNQPFPSYNIDIRPPPSRIYDDPSI